MYVDNREKDNNILPASKAGDFDISLSTIAMFFIFLFGLSFAFIGAFASIYAIYTLISTLGV